MFLSGDIHSSSWSSLTKNVTYSKRASSDTEPRTVTTKLHIYSVISSPLAWGALPYFFSKLAIVPLQSMVLTYQPQLEGGQPGNWSVGERSSTIAFTSNYVRVDVEVPNRVNIRCRGAGGELVGFREQTLAWDV